MERNLSPLHQLMPLKIKGFTKNSLDFEPNKLEERTFEMSATNIQEETAAFCLQVAFGDSVTLINLVLP